MEIKPGMIADLEQARIAANAEKPIRDLAQEEGVTEEEKNILDKLAEKRGEKAITEHLSKNKIVEKVSEKVNEFGLPENWSHDLAVQALSWVREQLQQNPNPTNDAVKSWLERISKIANEQYKKYRPNEHFSVDTLGGINDLPGPNNEKLYSLKSAPEEKLKWLQEKYPQGLKIQGTNKHVKWEKIADYEMWAIKNHLQTLAEMNRRQGMHAGEIISIISGVNFEHWYKGEKTHSAIYAFENEKLIPWLREKGFLAD